MRFDTFFFDLDETLYPPGTGLWTEIAGRITRYMTERLGFPADEVVALREKYFREYGTTLRGLQANHTVDTYDYLAFVHDVQLDRYIHPDSELHAIEAIPARKFVFTNSDANHVNRVLKVVGLQGLFDGIIDVHAIAPYCKPIPESFELALKLTGSSDPRTCVLFDDQARITRAGRALGMYTVLVGKEAAGTDADAALLHLAGLGSLFGGEL